MLDNSTRAANAYRRNPLSCISYRLGIRTGALNIYAVPTWELPILASKRPHAQQQFARKVTPPHPPRRQHHGHSRQGPAYQTETGTKAGLGTARTHSTSPATGRAAGLALRERGCARGARLGGHPRRAAEACEADGGGHSTASA